MDLSALTKVKISSSQAEICSAVIEETEYFSLSFFLVSQGSDSNKWKIFVKATCCSVFLGSTASTVIRWIPSPRAHGAMLAAVFKEKSKAVS